MNRKPLVSIIVPFYNRLEYLKETLISITNQTFVDYEVIIVDDGSELQIVQEAGIFCQNLDERFKFYQRTKDFPKGANGCRSFGLKQSVGQYIKWFDSDDLMKPSFIEVQIEAIQSYQLDGVFANCKVYNEDFTVVKRENWRSKSYSDDFIIDYLKTRLGWQTGSGLWRKQSIIEIEPFKQNIKNAQEWIFHLYVLTGDFRLGVIEKELFKMRSHSDSISSKKSSAYYRNKFISRILAFNRLIETKNRGKRYLVKFMVVQIIKSPLKDKFSLLQSIFENLKINLKPKKKASLIKL